MSIRHRRQAFPLLPPWVATPSSVTVPALASASKSVPLSSLVSGNTVHSHGPLYFRTTFWKPRIGIPNEFYIFAYPIQRRKIGDCVVVDL